MASQQLMTNPTSNYVIELNREGIAYLAHGQFLLATRTFKQALEAVMTIVSTQNDEDSSSRGNQMQWHQYDFHSGVMDRKTNFEAFSVDLRTGGEGSDDDNGTTPSSTAASFSSSGSADNSRPEGGGSSSSSSPNFYNYAFLVGNQGRSADILHTAKPLFVSQSSDVNSKDHLGSSIIVDLCHSTVLMFNMALTFHNKEKLSSRQQNAIKFYNITINLIMDAHEVNDLGWTILIAALFNKACLLLVPSDNRDNHCSLYRFREAKQVIIDLKSVLRSTPYRPPGFQEEDVDDLFLKACHLGGEMGVKCAAVA